MKWKENEDSPPEKNTSTSTCSKCPIMTYVYIQDTKSSGTCSNYNGNKGEVSWFHYRDKVTLSCNICFGLITLYNNNIDSATSVT